MFQLEENYKKQQKWSIISIVLGIIIGGFELALLGGLSSPAIYLFFFGLGGYWYSKARMKHENSDKEKEE